MKEYRTLVLSTADAVFRVDRIPSVDPEEIASIAGNLLAAESPLEPEEMVFSHETVFSDPGVDGEGAFSVVVAVAAPIAAVERVRESAGVDAGGVARVDVAAFCRAHGFAAAPEVPAEGVCPVLYSEDGRLTLVVLRDRKAVFARSLCALRAAKPASAASMIRLALMRAEEACGAGALASLLFDGGDDAVREAAEGVARLLGVQAAPVAVSATPEAGALARTAAGASLNLFPETWREALSERAFKRRFFGGIVIAAAAWVVLTAVLFGYPALQRGRVKRLESAVAANAAVENAVNEIRERINVITRYSDRTYSPLEMLREVSIAKPDDVTFTSFRFDAPRREASVEATAHSTAPAYEFSNRLKSSPLIARNTFVTGPTENRGSGQTSFTLRIEFTGAGEGGANP